MTDDKKQTYDFICFTDLAYEFDLSEKKEIEKKIKRRLKYYNLGDCYGKTKPVLEYFPVAIKRQV
jgi:hypothetical protein